MNTGEYWTFKQETPPVMDLQTRCKVEPIETEGDDLIRYLNDGTNTYSLRNFDNQEVVQEEPWENSTSPTLFGPLQALWYPQKEYASKHTQTQAKVNTPQKRPYYRLTKIKGGQYQNINLIQGLKFTQLDHDELNGILYRTGLKISFEVLVGGNLKIEANFPDAPIIRINGVYKRKGCI